MFATRFQQRELGPAVDFQIRLGIAHRIHVTGLSRKIEEKMLPAQKLRQTVPIAHIRQIEAHLALKAPQIVTRAAVLRNETVENRDLGSQLHERASQIRSDKTQAARDQHALPLECLHKRLAGLHHSRKWSGT